MKEALNRASIEFCEENQEEAGNGNSTKNSKKTIKKKEERCGSGSEGGSRSEKIKERSFFKQRPRSGNVFYMEKRLKEMGVHQDADLKDYLKPLIEEWKGLNPEDKEIFEEEAENELLNFI